MLSEGEFNMSYSPTLGRFLERDPIGSAYLDGPGKSDVVEEAETDAIKKLASIISDPQLEISGLLQYANGANSYQFVGSNPLANTDPSGLFPRGLPPSMIAPIAELGGIISAANLWNGTRGRVWYGIYECYDIATDMEKAVIGNRRYKFWKIGVIGGRRNDGYHHHAVVVFPKPVAGVTKPGCGVVLDGFIPGAGPVNICTVADFFKRYPNPSKDLNGYGPVAP